MWEVGKIYKTVGGSDAIIYAIWDNSMHGAVASQGVWYIRAWTPSGRVSEGHISSVDLVENAK